MQDLIDQVASPRRFLVVLLGGFAAFAVILAALGIYALISYGVTQRRQEIGIRIALGAEAEQVRRMVVVQGMRLAIVGVVVGLAAAWGLTRWLTSVLYQVQARDPAVFIVMPLVLTVVSLIAVWLPARRASAVSPLTALRAQ